MNKSQKHLLYVPIASAVVISKFRGKFQFRPGGRTLEKIRMGPDKFKLELTVLREDTRFNYCLSIVLRNDILKSNTVKFNHTNFRIMREGKNKCKAKIHPEFVKFVNHEI